MDLPLYQIDAFTSETFRGNPAAVCLLDEWLDDSILQCIAMENNLSETAFLVNDKDSWQLRWFTPTVEVDLCGHATLASAFVLFNELNINTPEIVFKSKSGKLIVTRQDDILTLNFPMENPRSCQCPDFIDAGINEIPYAILQASDYIVVFEDEMTVRNIEPDFKQLSNNDLRGVIITAPGKQHDFVSRFFAPNAGIPEDPVTGSAHCSLTPYWAERLNKTSLSAAQLSQRGGELICELGDERVYLSGQAIKYFQGQISI